MSERVLLNYTEPIVKFDIDPSPAWGRDKQGNVWVRCACKQPMQITGIGEDWSIDSEGNVSPSLWHDSPECGWHVFVTLQDYDSR